MMNLTLSAPITAAMVAISCGSQAQDEICFEICFDMEFKAEKSVNYENKCQNNNSSTVKR